MGKFINYLMRIDENMFSWLGFGSGSGFKKLMQNPEFASIWPDLVKHFGNEQEAKRAVMSEMEEAGSQSRAIFNLRAILRAGRDDTWDNKTDYTQGMNQKYLGGGRWES